jgi:hypothetical protein
MSRRKINIVGKCSTKRNGHNALFHVKCPKGGREGIAVTAYGYRDLPMGFGVVGKKFIVDCARQKFYGGFCMDCGKEGDFILNRKPTFKTKMPRAINRKLQEKREQLAGRS